MKKKSIFTFEAVENMILADDIILADGTLIVATGTILTTDIIARLINYHILEIMIYDVVAVESSSQATGYNVTYIDKIKASDDFKKFNADYSNTLSQVKDILSSIAFEAPTIDTQMLLDGISSLVDDSRNSLRLFDMLHSMRQYDDLTYIHSVNVSLISSVIGKWLGFSEKDCEVLMLCGLFHDIGKLLVPNEIITKPQKLTSEEYEIVKNHVSLGYEKLKSQNIDSRIKESCLYHHERNDGSGYPFGLNGNDIPVFAKIVAIADVYDAMTSTRVYREAICPFEVVRVMEADAFSKFDPTYLLPFLNNLAASYIHTSVKLSNNKIGEVILINQHDLSNPVVKCRDEFIDLSKQPNISIVSLL